eukprot:scaffold344583_cov30-Prasinocladus_malaysianus.AAC.1
MELDIMLYSSQLIVARLTFRADWRRLKAGGSGGGGRDQRGPPEAQGPGQLGAHIHGGHAQHRLQRAAVPAGGDEAAGAAMDKLFAAHQPARGWGADMNQNGL